MTEDEARKVLELMSEADGHCLYCAGELMARFAVRFPKFEELSKAMYLEVHDKHLDIDHWRHFEEVCEG